MSLGWPEQLHERTQQVKDLREQIANLTAQLSAMIQERDAHGAERDEAGKQLMDCQYSLAEVTARLAEAEKILWRCFGCGFETADNALAAAHFGDIDDGDEFKPICKWWSRMTPAERGDALQDVVAQLNEARQSEATMQHKLEDVEVWKNRATDERVRATTAETALAAKSAQLNDLLNDVVDVAQAEMRAVTAETALQAAGEALLESEGFIVYALALFVGKRGAK